MSKKLEWPISEDMIGKKVVFKGFTDPLHDHWGFTEGCEYTVNKSGKYIGPLDEGGEAPDRNWGFDFELVDDESEDMSLKDRIEQLEKELAELKKGADVEPIAEEWQPQGGSWYISAGGEVRHGPSTPECKLFGMEYPTEELAGKALKAMRQHNRLLAYVMEHAPDYEPDWEGEDEPKCYVENYVRNGQWGDGASCLFNRVGLVYMPEDVAERLVEDLNSGRVKL